MAYAPISAEDLREGVGMSFDEFEAWLVAHGVKKRGEKRVKRSYSLYD